MTPALPASLESACALPPRQIAAVAILGTEGGIVMSIDNRDVLDVLKAELNFIEKGGYVSRLATLGVNFYVSRLPSCLNFESQRDATRAASAH